jgi:hypothetical protein
MRTKKLAAAAVLALGVFCGSATSAHAQQTVNLTLGGFLPFGQDGRVSNDVLLADHRFLAFDFKDLSNATAGAEWLVPVGPVVEFGVGASMYRRTLPTVYRDFVASDGTEIEQNLRLRMIPVSLTARIVPTGQDSPFQPYVGAGLAIVSWRYSEFGDFVDFGSPGLVIRPGVFVAKGTELAPVVVGGLRLVSDTFSLGGEVRYQKADAELDNRFAASALDLGGWTYQATLGVRFGR